MRYEKKFKSMPSLLQFEPIAPAVYKSLQELKRTGWVMGNVSDPESVKEHTEALLLLAQELLPSLANEEGDGLLEMLEVHDWPEAIHGDEVLLELDPIKRKALKKVKFEKELAAMKTLCKDISIGDDLLSIWLRFETSNDPAADFARQLDKYQAVEKALEYEQTQGIPLFNSFLEYSLNFISHPVLLDRIGLLKVQHRG